jgi:glutathionyl-hydroquinone reductase
VVGPTSHEVCEKLNFHPLCVTQAESGRYHLYVGNACPWCHRVLLVLILRGLLPHITVTFAVDDPERASRGGWVFDKPEEAFGCKDLRCDTLGKFQTSSFGVLHWPYNSSEVGCMDRTVQ